MKRYRMWVDENHWYRPSLTWVTALLLPLSWLFGVIVAVRRWCYQANLFKSFRFNIPVMIVGNVVVGGTGKTPCVIALANYLLAQGFHPAIVSRGYYSRKHSQPVFVTPDSLASEVGDEAVLMARKSQCQVVIGADRVAAVRALLQRNPACDVVICDDGLQHYRLAREIEIAVVDGERHFGNGCLLPAGPLREPLSRLKSIDYVIVNGGEMVGASTMTLEPQQWVSLVDKKVFFDVSALPLKRVHAVAGIGNPERFFTMLRKLGYEVIPHSFPDHHDFKPQDLAFNDGYPILMTGKDAVKCEQFADDRMWYLDIIAKLDDTLLNQISHQLQGARSSCSAQQINISR